MSQTIKIVILNDKTSVHFNHETFIWAFAFDWGHTLPWSWLFPKIVLNLQAESKIFEAFLSNACCFIDVKCDILRKSWNRIFFVVVDLIRQRLRHFDALFPFYVQLLNDETKVTHSSITKCQWSFAREKKKRKDKCT